MQESGKRHARNFVLANCAAPLADEGSVPLSVPSRIGRAIVPPEQNKQKDKHAGKEGGIYLHRKYGHRRGTCHDMIHVSDQRHDRDDSTPSNELQI